jgi:hypothetical protein
MTKKIIKPRNCRRCGKVYMPTSRLDPWCSDECKKIAYQESKMRKICHVCGGEFEGVTSAKFCDECKPVHHSLSQRNFQYGRGIFEMSALRSTKRRIEAAAQQNAEEILNENDGVKSGPTRPTSYEE